MVRSPWMIASCMGVAALLAGCPGKGSAAPADGSAAVASAAAAAPGSAATGPAGTATVAASGSATAAAEDSRVGQARLDTAGVLCVARALRQGGMDVADAVSARLRQPETRELAATLRQEHRHGLERVTALAIRLGGVAPEESDLSRDVARETAEAIARLAATDDATLDAEYLAAEVALRRRALQLIDEELVVATTDGRVRDALATMRDQVTRHLAVVEQVGN